MRSYFIILNHLPPTSSQKNACKQIIKRQRDNCYNRDINKTLGKLRKLNHSSCLEGLKGGFLKQTVVELGTLETAITNRNTTGIEGLCHSGVAKDWSVPRAFGVCP